MTHKKFPEPGDPVYVPLQVGRAGSEDLGYMRDDTGVSISEKNCYYGELTGVYWVWKNIKTSDYVGICHYRRYFCTEEGRILTEREYEDILSAYDIITSKKLKLNFTYYEGYAGEKVCAPAGFGPVFGETGDIGSEEQLLIETVKELPEKYRVVIHLFYYEEMSVEEIGKITGMKASTVRTRLTRARKRLKEKLGGL